MIQKTKRKNLPFIFGSLPFNFSLRSPRSRRFIFFFFDATAKEEGRQEIPASRREEEEAPLFPGKQKPK